MTQSLSLFLLFQLSRVMCCRNFFTASSDSLFYPSLSLVCFFQSSSSSVFLTFLLTQSSHLNLGLPRLLKPSSHNDVALFGSLSSAIRSTCPAHCSLLLASLSVKLLCTSVSYRNSNTRLLYALVLLLLFVPSCVRTLASFVVVVRSVPKFSFRTGMLVPNM